jgi:hypothetical protein
VKQIYEGKKPLYTFSPPAANESALKANHQAVVDVRTYEAHAAFYKAYGSMHRGVVKAAEAAAVAAVAAMPTPAPTPRPAPTLNTTGPTNTPTEPTGATTAPTEQTTPDVHVPLGHSPGMRYSAAYKIGLASALAVAPHTSVRVLGTLQGLLVQGFLKEAARLGYTKLDELTDDVIVKLTPNKGTVARGLELAQYVVDHEHERDFDAAEVLAVFCMNDAGNKKKDKLTQRLYAAWNKALGKVVLHHHASTKVKAAGLAETVRVDLEQLNVPADHVLGGITDNAPDVFITFTKDMQRDYPQFIGTGCILHALHLMIMRPLITAFGEQIKPAEGERGAGKAGVLRVGFMVHYLIALEPDTWRSWARANGNAAIAFIPTGASEGRWWSVSQALQDVFLHFEAYRGYFIHMANALGAKYGRSG